MKYEVSYKRIYKVCFALYMVIMLFSNTTITKILGVSNALYYAVLIRTIPVLLLLLILFDNIMRKTRLKQFFVLSIVVVLGIIDYIYVNNALFLISLLFIVSYPRDMLINEIAITLEISLVVSIFVTAVFSKIGLAQDRIGGSGMGGIRSIRHSLGFVSANSLANYIALATIVMYYMLRIKWKSIYSIFLLALTAWTYLYTGSRTGSGAILIVSLGSMVISNRSCRLLSRFLYKAASWLFLVLSTTFLALALYFRAHPNTLYIKLNDLLSGRLYYGIYFINNYGVRIFGSKLRLVGVSEALATGKRWLNLDNSYLMISIQYGLAFVFLFSIGYYLLGKRLEENGDLPGAFVVVVILLCGITENYLVNICFNFGMILFAREFLNDRVANRIKYKKKDSWKIKILL